MVSRKVHEKADPDFLRFYGSSSDPPSIKSLPFHLPVSIPYPQDSQANQIADSDTNYKKQDQRDCNEKVFFKIHVSSFFIANKPNLESGVLGSALLMRKLAYRKLSVK